MERRVDRKTKLNGYSLEGTEVVVVDGRGPILNDEEQEREDKTALANMATAIAALVKGSN